MKFSYDHIHLRSRDFEATAEYYARVFGAQVLRSVQSDGQSRIDLDIDGLTLFLAKGGRRMKTSPKRPPSRTWGWTTSALRSTTWTRPPPK